MAIQVVKLNAGGTMAIPAMPCGVPGLSVHRVVLTDGEMGEGLCLTHCRSGLAVGYFPVEVDPEAVLACAQDLARLADWTLPAADLRGLDENAVIAVTERWGSVPMGVPATDFGDVGAVDR